ncbi:MAG: esterase family protein [Chitinophagaceae bacterium]|nr:MAG: esterase family protein [Chitinophagaceae bacterium]
MRSLLLPVLLIISFSGTIWSVTGNFQVKPDDATRHARHLPEVDTVTIRSDAMGKDIRCVVIRPDTPDKLPVLYLLHGWSGNYSNWITKVPELARWAKENHLMIVCPDGNFSSWYFDSPVEPGLKYETYIGTEVPAYIDSHYPTRRDRNSRAITGLSMGGHGALFIAFRHAATFGAAGSMSGGLDLTGMKAKYDIYKRLGDTTTMSKNYADYSVINVIDRQPTEPLAITFDCGTADGFYNMNLAVHQKMLRLKIKHDYAERPGGHDWKYWKNSLKYQLVFFSDYFNNGL